jgi:hypothetical protein
MNTSDIENRIKFLSENNEINWTQQGWQCPVCKAVMSPTTSVCVNCKGVGHEVVVNTLPSIQPSIQQYIDWSKETSGTGVPNLGVTTALLNKEE